MISPTFRFYKLCIFPPFWSKIDGPGDEGGTYTPSPHNLPPQLILLSNTPGRNLAVDGAHGEDVVCACGYLGYGFKGGEEEGCGLAFNVGGEAENPICAAKCTPCVHSD